MTSTNCSRCGQRAHCEYGSDGLPYCSSCIFYGLNKQCWRCRMYLPASELQQYRGQWMCPYCVQDMRDEDRKKSEYVAEKPRLEAYQIPEQCDRCGRDLENHVYFWNGRKLCRKCVEAEQDKWGLVGGGPMAAPYRVTLKPERRRKKMSLIESLIGDALQLLGLRKRKEGDIVPAERRSMPIERARPMAEKPMIAKPEASEAERRPKAEGIIKPTAAKAAPQSEKWASAKKEEYSLAGQGLGRVPKKAGAGRKASPEKGGAGGKKKKQ